MNKVAQKSTGWREVCLADVVDQDSPICYGIVLPGHHVDGGVPVIKVKDIAQGSVRTTGLLRTSPEIDATYKRSRLIGGDILLSIRGTVGRIGVVPDELTGANITQDTARIRISCSDTRAYVYQALQSDYLRTQIRDRVVGQAVKGINIRDVKRLKLLLPSEHSAQKYVADLLGTQDAAIQKTEQLISATEQRHRALLISLLGKKLWSECRHERADGLFEPVSERNQPALPVLAVTQDQGVLPRKFLDRRITMELSDPATFKVVRKDDFVISLRSFQGGLEYSAFDGLVSPAYTVLRCKPALFPRFYRHYLKSPDFVMRLAVAVVGIRDGKQINFTDFASIKLPLPSIEVQCRMADLMDESEREIGLLKNKLGMLHRQKSGLMQKLLAGRWRLPVSEKTGVVTNG